LWSLTLLPIQRQAQYSRGTVKQMLWSVTLLPIQRQAQYSRGTLKQMLPKDCSRIKGSLAPSLFEITSDEIKKKAHTLK
ncbi:hypothetical protein H8959_010947, partial [Pygathrix nigripes]